ncbi:hypothetical protein ACUSIJ_24775 [Pseudochelatococcus sp. B33]
MITTYPRTLSASIERAARAVFEAGADTTNTHDCWQAMLSAGININGHCARAEWFYDEAIARVHELRAIRAEALSALAEIDAELIGSAA